MATNIPSTLKPALGSYTSAKTSVQEVAAEHGEVLPATRVSFAIKVQKQSINEPAYRSERFWAVRWRRARPLSTIDAMRRLPDQIGGRL